MCGIVGAVGPGLDWAPQFVAIGAGRLAHRGPDGEGTWSRSRTECPDGVDVCFGHRRLAVIDVSDGGAQPMKSSDGAAVLVFNGEIYNYIELRAELRSHGFSFRSESDTEVLLAAYTMWGRSCLEHLNGMFAFALWDEKRQSLFCARDRLGEKPFHYVWDPQRLVFAFASEMKGLMALPGVSFTVDDLALGRWVGGECIATGDRCVVFPVKRLGPGELIELDCSGGSVRAPSVRRWWDLPPAGVDGPGLDAGASQIRDLLAQSVRLRVRSDVAVGSSLSGGLDSSLIVGLVRCVLDQTARDTGSLTSPRNTQMTFTARMSEPNLDEGQWASLVVASMDVDNAQVWPQWSDLVEHFDTWMHHLEEPVGSTAPLAQFLVMKLARDNGVVVLLDGQGADELFGGYPAYFVHAQADLVARGRVLQLARQRQAHRRVHGSVVPLLSRVALARSVPRLRSAWRARPGKAPDPVWAAGVAQRSARAHEPSPRGTSLERRLRWDLTGGPLQDLLRFGDRNSMAWGREVRMPYLDPQLVEFASSLPVRSKVSDGITKRVLREAARGIVPDQIVDRTDKLGYQAPLASWLGGVGRDWTAERLSGAREILGDRVRPGVVDDFRTISAGGQLGRAHASRYFSLITAATGIDSLLSLAARGLQ